MNSMPTRWGVAPPIDQDVRLGDFVNAEQAFALGEALTGLDAADVRRPSGSADATGP